MIEFNATFLVAMFSFIVFMIIMNAIFYRPVLNMVKKREQYINSNLDEAKDNSLRADECKNHYEQGLSSAKEECRKNIASALEQAKKDANQRIDSAKVNIKSEIQSKTDILRKDKENLEQNINISDFTDAISKKITGGRI